MSHTWSAVVEAMPDKAAVIMASTGDTVSFGELDARSRQLAQHWYSVGLRPGDHVAIWAENMPEYYEVYWAAMRSGLYLTTLNRSLAPAEAAYILLDSDAKSLVVSSTYATTAAAAITDATNCSEVLTIDLDGRPKPDDFLDYRASRDAQPADPLESEETGSTMLYSSGTTGRPKGVKVPLSGTVFGTKPNSMATLGALLGMSSETIYLSPAPLYHGAPLFWSTGLQELGATIVVMEKFDPIGFLRSVDKYSASATQVVPTMFVRMLKLTDEERLAHDLSSLTFCVHAAAPCPVTVKQQMLGWWGPIIHEYYAGTERNGSTWIRPEEWLERPGSVGRAIDGELVVCDDDGRRLGPGETGTVYFASPAVPFEYHDDPDKTAESRHPNQQGLSTLGDIGYVDDDGYLYLTDRKAFMVISGGVNIYPQEVEDCLISHPDVMDVAVFGLPDTDMGEYVHAVVQPVDGLSGSDQLREDLIAFARNEIAHYKVPRTIDFRPELPRQATGKLHKKRLREEYLDQTV